MDDPNRTVPDSGCGPGAQPSDEFRKGHNPPNSEPPSYPPSAVTPPPDADIEEAFDTRVVAFDVVFWWTKPLRRSNRPRGTRTASTTINFLRTYLLCISVMFLGLAYATLYMGEDTWMCNSRWDYSVIVRSINRTTLSAVVIMLLLLLESLALLRYYPENRRGIMFAIAFVMDTPLIAILLAALELVPVPKAMKYS